MKHIYICGFNKFGQIFGAEALLNTAYDILTVGDVNKFHNDCKSTNYFDYHGCRVSNKLNDSTDITNGIKYYKCNDRRSDQPTNNKEHMKNARSISSYLHEVFSFGNHDGFGVEDIHISWSRIAITLFNNIYKTGKQYNYNRNSTRTLMHDDVN